MTNFPKLRTVGVAVGSSAEMVVAPQSPTLCRGVSKWDNLPVLKAIRRGAWPERAVRQFKTPAQQVLKKAMRSALRRWGIDTRRERKKVRAPTRPKEPTA